MTSKEKFDWIKENISIVDYASSIGFTPVRKGKYYSLKEHDSIIIDTHKNVYWQNSISGYGKCIGEMGSIIDFAMKFCNLSFYEVIRQFEGDIPRDSQCQVRKEKRISDKTLKLPAKDANMRKVYAYLIKTRNIKPDVVQFFVDNKMLYQDKNGNCRQNNTVRIGMMFSRVIRSLRRMIIRKLNIYDNIEIFHKLDEIEKIQKASKKKHGNLTETVEQTVNDWEK